MNQNVFFEYYRKIQTIFNLLITAFLKYFVCLFKGALHELIFALYEDQFYAALFLQLTLTLF